jgi:outer membrane murein-binding lipoprotein Lpp
MKTKHLLITLVLFVALLLAGCGSEARVGALQTESQSVELGNAESVRVEIAMGAGNLQVTGGAEKLLEADFNYNVAALKPEVSYTDGTLVVRQPEVSSLPDLRDITDFRNEWDLRLYDEVPMDLSVDVGGGTSDLQLAGLSLTKLDITLGAGTYTVDLSGDWARDLDVTIDAGAADVVLRLPRGVGARVNVEPGPHTIQAIGLTKDGAIYTNGAYGVSDVTLQIDLQVGIGLINLEVEDAAATLDSSPVTGDLSQLIPVSVEKAGITGQSCDHNEIEMLATRSTYVTYA